MPTPVTQSEIIAYREYRDLGLSVRSAAAKVGRPPSSLHAYDPRRQRKSKSPTLEQAIVKPIEAILADANPMDTPASTGASSDLSGFPTIREQIRRLVNRVMGIVGRRKPARAEGLVGGGDFILDGLGGESV